jgi:hypothetical protein
MHFGIGHGLRRGEHGATPEGRFGQAGVAAIIGYLLKQLLGSHDPRVV